MSRQKSLFGEQERSLIDLCNGGTSIPQAAKQYGISVSTVTRILRRARNEGVQIAIRKGRRPTRPRPSFDIVTVSASVVAEMCARYHGYGSAGKISVYNFAVVEDGRPVAVFAWQPPPPGAASAVCPEAPYGVLALSRMVAVPKEERRLRHISKPLRYQMLKLIDRTRWPVLITYSDEGQGHTGHVYKCSGWRSTARVERDFFVDVDGKRASFATSDKKRDARNLKRGGTTTLQRWEHWACAAGGAAKWVARHGWQKIHIAGRVWRSGNPAFTWVRQAKQQPSPPHI